MGTKVPSGMVYMPDRAGLAAELLDAADEAVADREGGIRRASGPTGWHVSQAIYDQWDEDNPPAAPTDVTATAGVASITIAWTAVPGDVVGYRVYRAVATGVDETDTLLGTVIGAVEFEDTTATAGSEFFYAVTAVRGNGTESAASVEDSAEVAE